jgi:hypothetical protein
MPESLFSCPPDLTLSSDAELATLDSAAEAEFDRVYGLDDPTPELLGYARQIVDDRDRIHAELAARQVRAERTAAAAQDNAQQIMAQLAERVHGPAEPAEETVAAVMDPDAIAAAAARGVTQGLMAVLDSKRGGGNTLTAAGVSLGDIARKAPAPVLPKATIRITSAIDVPAHAITAGAVIPDMDALTAAMIERASNIPITQSGKGAARYPVATIHNEFEHTVDERTGPAAMEALFRSMTSDDKAQALLAGGGWCAPSEIRYDLFNIADAPSGLIDMPTVGVSRGGLRFPVSPSIADVFFTAGASAGASGMGGFAFPFSNASDPWLWSETDDILTVTGSVNKPNLRVPCPTFSEERLEVYGLSLIAGNLTDSAYPESTQNTLRLLRQAYAHTVNARLINLMVTRSSVTQAIGAGTQAAFNTILDGVELAATDYRNKFGMADDAVLEAVFPRWILAVIRADLAWRTAVELVDVPDSMIRSYFTTRGISPQFVSDWQVRGANQFGRPAAQMATWPTSCQFMMYAAGTFIHGTGLRLDLGVIRDSVLNAENDYTAAWAEEAHLVAKVGHESRLYTATFGVNGAGVLGQTNAHYL